MLLAVEQIDIARPFDELVSSAKLGRLVGCDGDLGGRGQCSN